MPHRRLGFAVLLALLPLGLEAQQGQPPQPPPGQTEVTLVYEREVFRYEAAGRRDPFGTLTATATGPRFEELRLRGIIYATGGRSVALLSDASGRIHRVRTGDTVGNTRVLEIRPLAVDFAVDEFGTIRQESLELQRRGQ